MNMSYGDKDQIGRVTRESLGHLKGIDGAFTNKDRPERGNAITREFIENLSDEEREIYYAIQLELESTELMRFVGTTKDAKTLAMIRHVFNMVTLEQLTVIQKVRNEELEEMARIVTDYQKKFEQLKVETQWLEEVLKVWKS